MFSLQEQEILQSRFDSTNSVRYLEIAKISVAEVMSAIRVAPSYKEIFKKDDGTEIVKYINERDYYGKRPYLNQNAIYLFLYLHFLSPSSDGAVCFSVKEVSNVLGLPPKTIRLNLRVLANRQYISFFFESGLCFASILDYSSMFKPASASGRGFFMMSFDMFLDLVGCARANSINELRIQLRGIISCVPGLNFGKTDNSSIYDLKKFFPDYVSLKNLKLLLMTDNVAKFFHVSISHGTIFHIITKKQYNPLELKKATVENCDIKVRELIASLQKDKNFKLKKFSFSEKDFSDISNISLRLPLCDVLSGVRLLFESYSAASVDSIGALVRSLSEDAHIKRLAFSG